MDERWYKAAMRPSPKLAAWRQQAFDGALPRPEERRFGLLTYGGCVVVLKVS